MSYEDEITTRADRIMASVRLQNAVDTLVRILWTVIPLAAAEQRGRERELDRVIPWLG